MSLSGCMKPDGQLPGFVSCLRTYGVPRWSLEIIVWTRALWLHALPAFPVGIAATILKRLGYRNARVVDPERTPQVYSLVSSGSRRPCGRAAPLMAKPTTSFEVVVESRGPTFQSGRRQRSLPLRIGSSDAHTASAYLS